MWRDGQNLFQAMHLHHSENMILKSTGSYWPNDWTKFLVIFLLQLDYRFSTFSKLRKFWIIFRKEVEEAYFELRGTEIPNFVESLKKQCECLIREELIKSIHQFGINIRYIGFVRSLINEQMILKAHLLAEMIIRVTKNYIRSLILVLNFVQKNNLVWKCDSKALHLVSFFLWNRSRLRNAKSEESIRRIIVHHFNLLLGNSHASSFFWHFFIKVFESDLQMNKATFEHMVY